MKRDAVATTPFGCENMTTSIVPEGKKFIDIQFDKIENSSPIPMAPDRANLFVANILPT